MEQKTKSGFSLYVNSNENIQNALFLREKKKKYRMGLIIAFVVVCICTIFAYRYRTYHRMKVVKTITKELTESFQSFAYKKGTICYSEDGISFLDGKGNEKWNTPQRTDARKKTSCRHTSFPRAAYRALRCPRVPAGAAARHKGAAPRIRRAS